MRREPSRVGTMSGRKDKNVPSAFEFFLLAGAAFRVWRIVAADTIFDRPREWLTRRAQAEVPGKYREEVDIFLHCPFCAGWWITLAWWAAWLKKPRVTTMLAVPFAANAVVGLVAKNLDKDDPEPEEEE